jgi:hypothetical protein
MLEAGPEPRPSQRIPVAVVLMVVALVLGGVVIVVVNLSSAS